MSCKIFKDYGAIDSGSAEGRRQMFGAISYFMQQPADVQDRLVKAAVSNYTTTSDFPDEVKELIEKWHIGIQDIDNAWAMFFTSRDFAGVKTPGFRVREVQSGLTFAKRPEGGRAKIHRISGTEVFVGFDMYGGGLEFDQAWFDDQQWWDIEDSAMEFRSKWYRDKATVFYTLIGALAAGYNIAYDATGSTQLDKDINTINNGCADLVQDMYDAGYGVTAQTPLVLLSPIQLKGRLQRAMAAQYVNAGVDGASMKVEYNISIQYSLNVKNAGAASTDKWYLGIPGMKNKIGEKMPLTVYTDFNARSYATTAVGWGRYGAFMNPEQFRRLATA
jgi:hypothetical protein